MHRASINSAFAIHSIAEIEIKHFAMHNYNKLEIDSFETLHGNKGKELWIERAKSSRDGEFFYKCKSRKET
jgi:hypothetical protein